MDCTDICIRNRFIDTVLLYCMPMRIYWINVSESESESNYFMEFSYIVDLACVGNTEESEIITVSSYAGLIYVAH